MLGVLTRDLLLKTNALTIFITLLTLTGARQLADAKPLQSPTALFDSVSAKSMRANLRFLASDELKGRDTPSPELDIAANWIASEFEKAGLKPVGKDGFFQVATFREKLVKNVVGLIEGSDLKLSKTYLLVTGHYDHVGMRGTEGDTIFNGANDNGSSIVSMVELARAFGAMKTKPKRSILMMAF